MKLREEWEGREVKEQRTQGTGGENPTIGKGIQRNDLSGGEG